MTTKEKQVTAIALLIWLFWPKTTGTSNVNLTYTDPVTGASLPIPSTTTANTNEATPVVYNTYIPSSTGGADPNVFSAIAPNEDDPATWDWLI